LRSIAEKKHFQKWKNQEVSISVRTLERWYAGCRKASKPPEALQPKMRSDIGKNRTLSEEHKNSLLQFQMNFPSWSIKLMYDNLCCETFQTKPPSYSTVLRYVKRGGTIPKIYRKRGGKLREVRSFEVAYVGELWHMDFHKGSKLVTLPNGDYKQAICAAFIDDKSRLVCHAQWYLQETTEVLVHALIQALLKRGIPRGFYTDNGSAMKGEELVAGLKSLGIKHETTLPYSPYQNGKQESFWQPLEGRLMKMLPDEKRITLDVLNRVTQAWVEQDYHDSIHSEIKKTPLHSFFNDENVLRPALGRQELIACFRTRATRTVRKTDGTITLDGVRFEVPQIYKHHDSLVLSYAKWDLGEAEIICPSSFKSLRTIYPINKLQNSLSYRKEIEESHHGLPLQNSIHSDDRPFLDLNTDSLPPLLAQCLQKQKQQFPHASYLPLETRIP
jgi:putative transposase